MSAVLTPKIFYHSHVILWIVFQRKIKIYNWKFVHYKIVSFFLMFEFDNLYKLIYSFFLTVVSLKTFVFMLNEIRQTAVKTK